MPMYDFLDKEDSTTYEFFFNMSEVPSIGAEVVIEGKTYVRLPSVVNGIADNTQPKTVGQLAYANREKMEKEGDPRIKKRKKKENEKLRALEASIKTKQLLTKVAAP